MKKNTTELRQLSEFPDCPPCSYDRKFNPKSFNCINCGYIGIEMEFDEELKRKIEEAIEKEGWDI